MKPLLAMLCLAALAFSGCGKKPIAEDTDGVQSGDTRPLLAADLIGMDGQQLKDTADQMKATTEKHNQELQKALENASK